MNTFVMTGLRVESVPNQTIDATGLLSVQIYLMNEVVAVKVVSLSKNNSAIFKFLLLRKTIHFVKLFIMFGKYEYNLCSENFLI